MKTAVSLPDEVFRLAERQARKLRVSRSELYARAISEFLSRQRTDNVTERLNEIYSRDSAQIDPVLQKAQVKSLRKEDW